MIRMIAVAAGLIAVPAFASQTAVSAGGSGSYSYDASARRLTATFPGGAGLLHKDGASLTESSTAATLSLTLDFADPLVRATNVALDYRFTGFGYRYIQSSILGTVTGVHFAVAAPDGSNLVTLDSTAGFSAGFEHFTSYDYYYYNDGSIRSGPRSGGDIYQHFLDFSIITLFPPCNCRNESLEDGFRFRTADYVLTSDIADYVQNIYAPSYNFDVNIGGENDPDLLAVRTSSRTMLGDFSGSIGAYFGPNVPEPDTWVLLIAGFGLTGAALRRRRAGAPAV